jgi:ribonuclease inhibitor
MVEVVIDGDVVQSEADVQRALDRQLEFGESCGGNLAALRDRLLTDVPRPVRIVWLSSGRSRERLGEPLFFCVVGVFEEAAQQDLDLGWADRFEFELR